MKKENKPFNIDPFVGFLLNMNDSQIKAFDDAFEESEGNMITSEDISEAVEESDENES